MSVPLLEPNDAPRRRSASHGEAGYARNARDAYFTEPWVTRALLAAVWLGDTPRFDEVLVWEPACGDGRMAREIAAAGYDIVASDIHDYGFSAPCLDFLDTEAWPEWLRGATLRSVAAIVTNPPFDLAGAFVRQALRFTRDAGGKVAMLQRHEFDAPKSNWPLFAPPFAAKLILPRRPRWATEDKASPRFPYAWYLWDWRHRGEPVIRWLPDPDKPPAGGALL